MITATTSELARLVTTWQSDDPVAACLRGAALDGEALARMRDTLSDPNATAITAEGWDSDDVGEQVWQTLVRSRHSRLALVEGDAAALLDLVTSVGLIAALHRPPAEVLVELLRVIDAACARAEPVSRSLPQARRAHAARVLADVRITVATLPPQLTDPLWSRMRVVFNEDAANRPRKLPAVDRSASRSMAWLVAGHAAELAEVSGRFVEILASAEGTPAALNAVQSAPAEFPHSAAGLAAASGVRQRIAWIEHEITRHAARWAPDVPVPRLLVDVPVARLVAPNAACFPLPGGKAIVALASAWLEQSAPMTRHGQLLLSALAAHEGVPGHALQHWAGHRGLNTDLHVAVADPFCLEGWAMLVEQAVGEYGGTEARVVNAYHALRRFLPATVQALRKADSAHAATTWLAGILGRCGPLAAQISEPGRFQSTNAHHYALGMLRTRNAVPSPLAAPLDDGIRRWLARGRFLPTASARDV